MKMVCRVQAFLLVFNFVILVLHQFSIAVETFYKYWCEKSVLQQHTQSDSDRFSSSQNTFMSFCRYFSLSHFVCSLLYPLVELYWFAGSSLHIITSHHIFFSASNLFSFREIFFFVVHFNLFTRAHSNKLAQCNDERTMQKRKWREKKRRNNIGTETESNNNKTISNKEKRCIAIKVVCSLNV